MAKARKWLAMLLAACLVVCGVPLSAAASSEDFETSGGTLVAYTGSASTVVIPNGVSEIGKECFKDNKSITVVEMPDTVTSIGVGAFQECTNLATVKFSRNLKEMAGYAFYGCSSLKEANLPEGLTTMGRGSSGGSSFRGCTSLSSIYIPSTLTDIPSGFLGSFDHCSNLANVTFGFGITAIPNDLFKSCDGLTSIEIPDTVTSIGKSAFSECDKLATVKMGSKINTVSDNAFYNNNLLADVYYAGSKAKWNTIEIGSNNEPLTSANTHYGSAGGDVPSTDTAKITTENLQTVSDGVVDVPYQVIIQTSLGEEVSKSHELVLEAGELPPGLVLETDGELHGIPTQVGEYEFTVALKALNSQDTADKRSYKIIVKESTPENVAEVNTSSQGYPLLDPLPDVIDFDKVESGTKFTFRSEGPFNELDAVYIDGDELTREVDYTASDGSCVIALNDMGYGGRTAGRHVISVSFKKPSTQGNFTIKKTAQVVTFENPKPRPIPKYRISLNIDRNGGGTALVSNKTAEAGKTITVTARPNYGWEIKQVTAGSAKVSKKDDKYTFTMPNSTVTVKVSFKRIGAAEGTGMPFFDVHTTDWFYKPAKVAYDAGLMKGTASNAFSPNHPALRAMIATILYRHAGSPVIDEACPFTDVKAGSYYEKAVIWAKQNWVIDGTSATKFNPSGQITREQLVSMLYRYAGNPEGTGDLSGFSDTNKLSGYAQDAMKWAVGNGIITGKGNNLLDPKGKATRAEIAAILQRFMDL